MSDTRLQQIGALLDSKNRTVRNEAASAFGKFSIADEKVTQIINKYLCSVSWDVRVSAGDALKALLRGLGLQIHCDEPFDQITKKLRNLDVSFVLKTFNPLLSENEVSIVDSSKLSSKKQRQIIDEHLELISATGLSSSRFLSDDEVLPKKSNTTSTKVSKCSDLSKEVCGADSLIKNKEAVGDEKECTESLVCKKLEKFVLETLPLIADHRWQQRHGAAIALSQIISSCYSSLSYIVIDEIVQLLIEVLILDQFNDFISGRTATAPVREACAQTLGHILNLTDESRRKVILDFMYQMLTFEDVQGNKAWNVRQSALLVLKYYFAVANMDEDSFEKYFDLVVRSLDDPVDDVVCCAVVTLSSVLANKYFSNSNANEGSDTKSGQLVNRVLDHIWRLLILESKKEQLRSGLDALCIDLMEIVEMWLRSDQKASLDRAQILTAASMLDSAFPTRSAKIVALIDITLEQGAQVLSADDVFDVLKRLYRILLFSAPQENTVFVEYVFLTSMKLLRFYKSTVIEGNELSKHIGIWSGCLLFDHRNPLINVFDYGVDGVESSRDSPCERMCSEEMRFLSEKEKDDVYVTRKILCSKLLALIIDILYESKSELNGQPISTALQLLFVPFFQSNSLMHNLGVALVVNEWAALYRLALEKGAKKEIPMTIVSLSDAILRGPPKNFDELTSTLAVLTNECNEFIDYCSVRGFNKKEVEFSANVTAEEISKMAYDVCCSKITQRQQELLDSRYKSLCEFIEFTRLDVAGFRRVYALLSSSLFYFGSSPEKLTPQIRPLVDAMQTEENEAVAAEVFRGAIPLLVAFSSTRQPKPFVKVLAKAIESFSSCSFRIPKPITDVMTPDSDRFIVTLDRINKAENGEDVGKVSAQSKNAELILILCSSFSITNLPEFYEQFDLDQDCDLSTLLSRLELHGCLWSRVISSMSDKAAEKVLNLLCSPDSCVRFAGSKAVEVFARSQLGQTISKVLPRLSEMASNMNNVDERIGAAETVLRLSILDSSLTGAATLLCPIAFLLLTDKVEEVREAAGAAFRRLVPLVKLENVAVELAGLSPDLIAKRQQLADFINVLSCPARLPLVDATKIFGIASDVQLRHYQIEGLTWMRFLRQYSLNGILADDMGLGKTLQTMCALAISCEEDNLNGDSRCSLIICPRTLVDHWCAEWKRFFPGRLPAEKSITKRGYAELVVIAYEELKTNILLQKHTWNYVVLDEGHIVRNPKTAIWRAAVGLKAKSRLVLSGTPIQNSPVDVWALFTWLLPGYLGTEKQFRANFLRKIIKCRSNKATEADMKNGSQAVAHLHRLILPFVLRRLKSEVLTELPEKNVQDYECKLSSIQKDIYRYIVDRCTSNEEKIREGNGISPLHALVALRKLIDHPKLVTDVLEKLNTAPQMIDLASRGGWNSSGKMEALGQLLNECGICKVEEERKPEEAEDALLMTEPFEQPHRALIFCQWKSSARLVSEALSSDAFGNPVTHLVLDGDVPPTERFALVNRFNSDMTVDVLILTTHIGGVGLNLTGADVVIFLDHDWNPMKDLQAIDRAHRLGQTRKVNVYRLITQGTVEEKVMSLHKFKLNTAQALIGEENMSLGSMQTTELVGMFTLDGDEKNGVDRPAEPSKKRTKKNAPPEGEWNLAEMWDESQYDAFNVQAFLKNTS